MSGIELTTQIKILIIVFAVGFGIPIVRWFYFIYKDKVEKRIIRFFTSIKNCFSDTLSGKSSSQKRKKKKTMAATSKTMAATSRAAIAERKQGP